MNTNMTGLRSFNKIFTSLYFEGKEASALAGLRSKNVKKATIFVSVSVVHGIDFSV